MTIQYGAGWEDARKREIAIHEASIKQIEEQEIQLAKQKAFHRNGIKESQSRLQVYYAQKEAKNHQRAD